MTTWIVGAAVLLVVAFAWAARRARSAAPADATPVSPAEFVDRLEKMSLTYIEMAKGTSADQFLLAVLMEPDNTVSQVRRPVLAGQFTIDGAAATAPTLSLHGALQLDASCVLTILITDRSQRDAAYIVNALSGAKRDLGTQGKIQLSITRTPGPPSREARLQAARLWALIGENVNVPSAPLRFEAAVLGTRLTKGDVPSLFRAPGTGTWVLLKTTKPDELYFAFDTETGAAEFFPKTPNMPNAAARALFRAL